MNLKTKINFKIALFIMILLLLIAVFFIYNLSNFDYWADYTNISSIKYPRMLDGAGVKKKDLTSLKPFAVVIDNHFQARPVAGIDKASIVYEVAAESGVTRYLAIFDLNTNIEKIGPVRSVRPYFIDYIIGWDPVLYHSGGSPAALAQLKQMEMWNLDEISANGIYFWRDVNKNPPHNLYTSTELIKQSFKDKDINNEANYFPWLFKDDLEQSLRPGSGLDIIVDFGEPEYLVEYKYNDSKNSYQRYLNNKEHVAVGANQIWAKNVVLLYTNSKIIDRLGRLSVDTQNGGRARVFQDGNVIESVWQNIDGQIRFFSENGEEIKFNRGSVWIEVLFNKEVPTIKTNNNSQMRPEQY